MQYATDQLQKFANSLPDLGSFLKPQPDTSPAASEQTAAIGAPPASAPPTGAGTDTSGAPTGSVPSLGSPATGDTTTPSTTADSVAQLQKFAETLGDPTAKFQAPPDQTPTQPLPSPAIPSPTPSTTVPTTQLSPDTTPTIASPSPPAAAPPSVPMAPAAATPRATGLPAAGDIAGWRQVIAQQVSPELAKVPQFIDTVLAGALAESGLNPQSVQQGGGGRGFFQFDVGGGMGTGLGPQQLFSEPFQASKIIPAYEAAWKAAPANLSPADKAAWVAVQAERPDDRLGQASARYRQAFATVSGTPQGLPRLYTPEQIASASTLTPIPSAPPAQPPAAPFSLANIGKAVGNFGLGAVQGASSLARGELAREANAQPISPTDYLTRGVLAGTDLYGQAVQKHLADVNAVEAMPEGPAKRDALFQLSQAGVMGVTGGSDLAAENLAGDVTRMYHGTGSAFGAPEAGKFDPNGLFGPGYYLTDSPEVASSYSAERSPGATAPGDLKDAQTDLKVAQDLLASYTRRGDQEAIGFFTNKIDQIKAQIADLESGLYGHGANVRAVNVPRGLNLLDADNPMTAQQASSLLDRLQPQLSYTTRLDNGLNDLRTLFARQEQAGTPIRFGDFYPTILRNTGASTNDVNRALGAIGYDGIRYSGGQRIPLMDAQGQPIQHTAVAIFPESLPKLTNAISGTTMGSVPAVGGAVLGGVAGYQTGNTPQERARNALIGAGVGAAGGYGLQRALPLAAPAIENYLNSALAPARNTPPEIQTALRDLANSRLQAAVDGQTLAMRAKQVLGKDDTAAAAALYEQTGQFVKNPNAAQQQLAADVTQYFQRTGAQGRANGYVNGDVVASGMVPNYFPHNYQDMVGVGGTTSASPKNLNPTDFYTQSRTIPDLNAAIAAGKKPVDSVSGPLGNYALHIQNSEAEYQALQALKNASPAAVMTITPGQTPPNGWNTVKVPRLNGYAFPDAVATSINNILSPSGIRTIPGAGAVMGALGEAKSTLFSLSQFHTFTLLRQAFRANDPVTAVKAIGQTLVNLIPSQYTKFRLAEADAFSEAASAGVTGLTGGASPDLGARVANPLVRAGVQAATSGLAGGAYGYQSAKNAGASEQDAQSQAALYGAIGAVAGPTAGQFITSALWERAVPTLKVLTFEAAAHSSGDRQAAATFVNQTFGGNNLAAIARSPTVQDAIRLAVMAPDWQEGWLRQIGGAFNPGAIGGLSRAYWARTAVESAVVLEGLNYAFSSMNGNPHLSTQNDPGHQAELELTGLYDRMGWPHADQNGTPTRVYADVLGPIRSMLQPATNPQGALAGTEAFAKGHESIPVSVGTAINSGVDWRGKAIVPPGTDQFTTAAQTLGYGLSQIAPVGAQAAGTAAQKNTPPAVAIPATVLGTRISTAGNITTRNPIQVTALPQSAQDIISKNRLFYNPAPPPGSLRGVILQQPEVDRYRTTYLQQLDTNLHALAADPSFARLTQVQKQHAFTLADQRAVKLAEGTVIQQMGDAEFQRRLAQHNAATAGATP